MIAAERVPEKRVAGQRRAIDRQPQFQCGKPPVPGAGRGDFQPELLTVRRSAGGRNGGHGRHRQLSEPAAGTVERQFQLHGPGNPGLDFDLPLHQRKTLCGQQAAGGQFQCVTPDRRLTRPGWNQQFAPVGAGKIRLQPQEVNPARRQRTQKAEQQQKFHQNLTALQVAQWESGWFIRSSYSSNSPKLWEAT